MDRIVLDEKGRAMSHRNDPTAGFAAPLWFVAPLIGAALLLAAPEVEAKGCIKGAAVGAVAGHVAGRHAVLGAAAGCAVGHHLAKKKQQQLEQGQPAPQTPQVQPQAPQQPRPAPAQPLSPEQRNPVAT